MTEKKKRDYKIGHCDYHLCKYHKGKKTKVYQCPYCKKWFCEKHIEPKPPYIISSNRDFLEAYYDEWATDDGHPCPEYVDIWLKEREEKAKEYSKALEALSNIKNKSKDQNTKTGSGHIHRVKETVQKSVTETSQNLSINPDNHPRKIPTDIKNALFFSKKFLLDIAYVVLLLVALSLTYSLTPYFNGYALLGVFKIGSLLNDALSIGIIYEIYLLIKSGIAYYKSCRIYQKLIIIAITIIILGAAYFGEYTITKEIKDTQNSINWTYFIPVNIAAPGWYVNNTNNYTDVKQTYTITQTEQGGSNSTINSPKNNFHTSSVPSEHELERDPKIVTLNYVIDGKRGYVNYTVYGGVNDYLSSIPREITYIQGQRSPLL